MNNLIFAIAAFFLTSNFTYAQKEGTFIIASGELNGYYEMTAIFNKVISPQVLECVNCCLIQNKNLFLKQRFQNAKIRLKDSTTFNLKFVPGELRIKFKKTDNIGDKYYSLIKRCEDLKDKINMASNNSIRH